MGLEPKGWNRQRPRLDHATTRMVGAGRPKGGSARRVRCKVMKVASLLPAQGDPHAAEKLADALRPAASGLLSYALFAALADTLVDDILSQVVKP